MNTSLTNLRLSPPSPEQSPGAARDIASPPHQLIKALSVPLRDPQPQQTTADAITVP